MEQKYVYVAVIAFVAIIIGIGFLTETGNITSGLTQIQTQTNESFTGVQSGNATLTHGNMTSFTALRNSTGSTIPTTNYTAFTTPGIIEFTADLTNGTYYADYLYQADNYQTDSGVRGVINLIVIVFALAILGSAIMFGYPKIMEAFGKNR